jgi:hypothetical protein
MKINHRTTLAGLACVVFLVHPLGAQERIVVSFDDDCASCSTTLAMGQQAIGRINAVRGGPTEQFGFTGAEFRVSGLPVGWLVNSVPNPAANIVLGDPFGDGAVIAFPTPLDGDCVTLFTIMITATDNSMATLEVETHAAPQVCPTPSTCACITCACDPLVTAYCAVGGQAYINGGECTVSVTRSTWGQIKRLFE